MTDNEEDRIAAEVAGLARSTGRTIAVAESLTGGRICAALAAAESASEWFRGGVVAYASEVKRAVLHVAGGPVVSAEAARAMGVGVRDLLDADVGVAVTGAGGPAPQDDQEPGTVFLAVVDGSDAGSEPVRRHIDGDPGEVCAAAVTEALTLLVDRLRLPAVTPPPAAPSGPADPHRADPRPRPPRARPGEGGGAAAAPVRLSRARPPCGRWRPTSHRRRRPAGRGRGPPAALPLRCRRRRWPGARPAARRPGRTRRPGPRWVGRGGVVVGFVGQFVRLFGPQVAAGVDPADARVGRRVDRRVGGPTGHVRLLLREPVGEAAGMRLFVGGRPVLVGAAPPFGRIHPGLERVEAQPVFVELLGTALGVRVGLHGVGVAGRRSTVVVLGHAISYPPSPIRTRATAPGSAFTATSRR